MIGRDPSCGIALSDPQVSEQHFRLSVHGRTVELFDLASSNGTRVNGRSVERVVLKPSDVIAAGDSAFVYYAPVSRLGPPLWPLLVAVVVALSGMLALRLWSTHRTRVSAEVEAILNRAHVLESIRDYPAAVAEYRRLARLDRTRKYDSAITALEGQTTLQRDLDRVTLLVDAGDTAGVRVALSRLVAGKATSSDLRSMEYFRSRGLKTFATYCRMRRLAGQGRYETARQVLAELGERSLDSSFVRAARAELSRLYFYEAISLLRKQNRGGALLLLRTAVEQDPDNSAARQVLMNVDNVLKALSERAGQAWQPVRSRDGTLLRMEACA